MPLRRVVLAPVALPVALLVVLLVVLVGCGVHDRSPQRLGAAEPATAPPLTRAPAGTVVDVAPAPQGIVFDPSTNLLAVAVHDPYRLLLLDPTTLQVRTSVPLPGKARHLTDARDGGPVLVPDETADELIEVALPSGSTRATPVGHHPHNAVVEPNGDIVVANEFSASLSLVRNGRDIATATGVKQPGGLAVDRGLVAVVDVGDFTVKTYDRTTLALRAVVGVGAGPTHGVMTTRHRLVVADTRGGRLYVLDLDPLEVLGSVALPGSPYGIAADPVTGQVWVSLTARNELVGFDLRTDTPHVIATYPTVRQPDTVAVAPGGHTLWVTGTRDGVVQRIVR